MSTKPTPAYLAGRAVAGILTGGALAAFEGGWLLMLLLGAVAHLTGDPRWALGYWTCVPLTLAARFLILCLTRSTTSKLSTDADTPRSRVQPQAHPVV